MTLPEQYSEHIKTIGGYPVRVTSFREILDQPRGCTGGSAGLPMRRWIVS